MYETVSVTNYPPTDLDLYNTTIDENEPANSVVGQFSTPDPDSGDSFTYALVTGDGDTDNTAFAINGDQRLCCMKVANRRIKIYIIPYPIISL